MYMINEISKLTGVSIRRLHHYDEIGLLVPSKRTESNYRMYSEEDVERLYQILLFKELDFPLQEIKRLLYDEEFDKQKALTMQRELIVEKKNRLENIIESIDSRIVNLGGKAMSKKDFKAFNYEEIKKHEEKYKEEVKERYGKTSAYKESKEKTSKYSKGEWENIMGEAAEIYEGLAALMDENPSNEKVQELVGKWRSHISKNYYNCTLEIFRGLALMYVADERFTENIDKYGGGLAQFLSEAMNIYCDNNLK
ncbi:DNA-binding transcriptional regulator, MerR family [Clostridium collagenovorans DSM 3089]|uniref:DNA-binding transcriptional regulator, MerR family n=1 Tax=Clostridium collagenovorans DSM 3089 TaxID=1121306 RepID=A0A1M5XQY5_9CLOT|nr:MerR family transcriptional regulator [Clostridium collagenovorans]SHI02255.1 DNA-binding transcriptional regulator, MerR family [Clostridium collagenovorans DSM 3089]